MEYSKLLENRPSVQIGCLQQLSQEIELKSGLPRYALGKHKYAKYDAAIY